MPTFSTFSMVAKSGILRLPTNYRSAAEAGFPGPLLPLWPLAPTLGLLTDGARINAMCATVNLTSHDQFISPARDGQYRLFSQVTFVASTDSRGNFVLTASPPAATLCTAPLSQVPVKTDHGMEAGFLHTPELTVEDQSIQQSSRDKYTVRWRVSGRPNLAAEPAFQALRPRLCRFIWHSVVAQISRVGPGFTCTAEINGSRFPTHALWLNGAGKVTRSQGTIGNLWVGDVRNKFLVR